MSFILKKFRNKQPYIKDALYIGDNCVIIGDVKLSKNVSIWSNSTIRGDLSEIIIGENTNIQDNTVIHVENPTSNNSLKGSVVIGKNTTIGHSCIIHSCKIGDNCLIGMGSIIGDGAVIEDGAFVGAGSNITPRTVVKKGEMWFGNPARFMRELRPDDIKYMEENIKEYLELAKEFSKN